MDEKKPLSFGFTKRFEPKKLSDSKLRDESTKEKTIATDFLTHVQDKQIHGSVKHKPEELVIPLITTGAWASKIKKLEDKYNQEEKEEKKGEENIEKKTYDDSTSTLTLEERAAKELIEESKKSKDEWDNRDKVNANLTIAADETNNDGAEESTMEDYDNVPIAEFGLACLKGMGWKPGQGIGKNNKGPISITDVQLRPKGLGLGANRQNIKLGDNDEELPLVRNAFVLVLGGQHKGADGQVEGIDEDGARVVVKLSSGDSVTISSSLLQVVKKQQLNVLNKEKYEKYKKLQDSQHSKSSNRKSSPEERERREREHRHRKDERDHHRSREHRKDRHHRDKEDYKERSDYHRDREDRDNRRAAAPHNAYDSSSHHRSSQRDTEESWVRSQLRVRIIDEHYLKGKYYNAKVEVVDVCSPTLCICRSQDGRVLDDVPTRNLETIVPKEANGKVIILRGRYKGKMAQILDRDRKKYIATLQLNSDRRVVKLSYDDICEYLGGDY